MSRFFDYAILEELRQSDRPLRHRDLVARIAPADRYYAVFNAIGMSLINLYRDGWLTREKCDGRYWHYTLAPERSGYGESEVSDEDLSRLRR